MNKLLCEPWEIKILLDFVSYAMEDKVGQNAIVLDADNNQEYLVKEINQILYN